MRSCQVNHPSDISTRFSSGQLLLPLTGAVQKFRDFIFGRSKDITPDDGVFLPYRIRQDLNMGSLLSKPTLLSSLGSEGMKDVGLYLTLHFLEGNILQQIKLVEDWSNCVLDSGSLPELAKICAYHLAYSNLDDAPPQKAAHVYRYGPTQYYNLFCKKLESIQAREMPCFIAYSGLLGLRAFLDSNDKQRSFLIYYPSGREFVDQPGLLPLVHFQYEGGQFKGRVLKWHELQELMKSKNRFNIIDDVLRSGKTLNDCSRHLSQLCHRGSRRTVLTVVSEPRGDRHRYEKWLMKHRKN